ncbi:unnamed protein product [Darwinula stevensoni]|uniref:Uncharacterized protein n=1 Tax=Darwinula stevensoni TaxID=69355 RepID=A0A7R8X9S1_9CRUS|nr:unnamed protein product [Darwinula stevensoni]CAG0884670.1 unnamed protein product [Darwinula stevensoni]
MSKDYYVLDGLLPFIHAELTRNYILENDEERFEEKRKKMYTFMKIPREVEKFMGYGFFQCADAFLFIFTFLPIRFLLALKNLLCWPLYLLKEKKHAWSLHPAEVCDLLKALILIICWRLMMMIDTSMLYHLVKSQSVIKLYIIFNMLEVGDRLFSSFGQDSIDALLWTATEPRGHGRDHLGVLSHLFLASLYFVELKSCVFKKFDKGNLFQVSCSDVRERFHYCILLLLVMLLTMKEYSWKEERFWELCPDCLLVLLSEFLIDWLKHAFITRFNEIPAEVYSEYTVNLAYDLASTKMKKAFSDHSDLVARRMGFIPLPLSVLVMKVLSQSISLSSPASILLGILVYLSLFSFRILNSIVILGKAGDLIDQHKRKLSLQEESKLVIPRYLFARYGSEGYSTASEAESWTPLSWKIGGRMRTASESQVIDSKLQAGISQGLSSLRKTLLRKFHEEYHESHEKSEHSSDNSPDEYHIEPTSHSREELESVPKGNVNRHASNDWAKGSAPSYTSGDEQPHGEKAEPSEGVHRGNLNDQVKENGAEESASAPCCIPSDELPDGEEARPSDSLHIGDSIMYTKL